jgi:hypothetical protein
MEKMIKESLMSEDTEEMSVPSELKTTVKGNECQQCSRALSARMDAVAGLPRQARGSRLRAHSSLI